MSRNPETPSCPFCREQMLPIKRAITPAGAERVKSAECPACEIGWTDEDGYLKTPQVSTDGGTSRSVAGQKADVREQFEISLNVFVGTVPDAHLEGILGTMTSYRNFIQKNLDRAGPIPPQKFVSWMRSADRDPDDFPEPWGASLVELFDGLLISAVEEDNIPPAVVVDALDQWVEESKTEVREIHNLPEDAFDV